MKGIWFWKRKKKSERSNVLTVSAGWCRQGSNDLMIPRTRSHKWVTEHFLTNAVLWGVSHMGKARSRDVGGQTKLPTPTYCPLTVSPWYCPKFSLNIYKHSRKTITWLWCYHGARDMSLPGVPPPHPAHWLPFAFPFHCPQGRGMVMTYKSSRFQLSIPNCALLLILLNGSRCSCTFYSLHVQA